MLCVHVFALVFELGLFCGERHIRAAKSFGDLLLLHHGLEFSDGTVSFVCVVDCFDDAFAVCVDG